MRHGVAHALGSGLRVLVVATAHTPLSRSSPQPIPADPACLSAWAVAAMRELCRQAPGHGAVRERCRDQCCRPARARTSSGR